MDRRDAWLHYGHLGRLSALRQGREQFPKSFDDAQIDVAPRSEMLTFLAMRRADALSPAAEVGMKAMLRSQVFAHLDEDAMTSKAMQNVPNIGTSPDDERRPAWRQLIEDTRVTVRPGFCANVFGIEDGRSERSVRSWVLGDQLEAVDEDVVPRAKRARFG